MWHPAPAAAISSEHREVLEGWVQSGRTPQSIATRARIILKAAEGLPNRRIAAEAGASRPTVILWRKRFGEGGPQALTKIEEGRGRKPSIPKDKVAEVI